MTPIAFTVEGPPQPKQRARKGRGGHWFTPDPTRHYERAVKSAASLALLACRSWPLDARYRVTVCAHFGNARRRDADNVGKAVLDACNGVLWTDDSQVASLTVERDIDRANPRTVVRVEVLR